ncbi:MAG TPA: hypothetical protein VK934_12350 [Fimbriimonas sp.]|nr:hypothetical protein [Fimbriimonas sp.]
MLAGCAGDATIIPDQHTDSPFVGVYSSNYTRGTLIGGQVTLAVTGMNSIEVSVDDNTAGFFHGTGVLQTNVFSVNCTKLGGETVTVTGTFQGAGTGRMASGNVTGAFTTSYTATFSRSPGITPLVGHYEGFYNGQRQGIFMFDVYTDGHITGTLIDDNTQIGSGALTGNVNGSGFISFTSGNPTTATFITFNGVLRASQEAVLGSGGFRDNQGMTGDWECGTSNGEG